MDAMKLIKTLDTEKNKIINLIENGSGFKVIYSELKRAEEVKRDYKWKLIIKMINAEDDVVSSYRVSKAIDKMKDDLKKVMKKIIEVQACKENKSTSSKKSKQEKALEDFEDDV